jgi:hypothetical protein
MIPDLLKVMGTIKYKGCIIKPKGKGYEVCGKYSDTVCGAKSIVDNNYKELQKSIR